MSLLTFCGIFVNRIHTLLNSFTVIENNINKVSENKHLLTSQEDTVRCPYYIVIQAVSFGKKFV